MKTIYLFTIGVLFAISSKSQTSWQLSLNTISGQQPNLGTINNYPINFFTKGIQRATLKTDGTFNLTNLQGTGSRFLQANSSGDIVEWSGIGDGTKALFGDNTWKKLPFAFDDTKISINPGTKLGVGVTSPAVALDVSGDAQFSGKVIAPSGFLLSSNNDGLYYNQTDNVFVLGKPTSGGNSPISPCYALPSGLTWSQSGGFKCLQVNPTSAPLVNSVLRTYLSPNNGNGYIEVEGTDNNGSYNALYINTNCGRNTNINTGTLGGDVNMGKSVKMAKHLEIGDAINGITNSPGNIALDIFANDGKGMRLKTNNSSNLGDMLTVEYGGYSTFNITTEGKTTINSSNLLAFSVKDYWGNGNPETFRINSNGSTEILSFSGGAAFTIHDGPSSTTKFEVQQDGTTYIAKNVGIGTPASVNTFLKVDAGTNNGNADLFSLSSLNTPSALKIDSKGITTFNTDAITTGSVFKIKNQGNDLFAVTYQGITYAREVVVTLSSFPDYVFSKEYNLMRLLEVKDYVNKNHRLPNMPSAEQVKAEGASIGEIQRLTVEKVEELYLYIFQLEEKIEKLNDQLSKIQK